MTSMPPDLKKKTLEFADTFVFLNPFEILSHYPNLDSSRWFREDFQWIIEKIFREQLIL